MENAGEKAWRAALLHIEVDRRQADSVKLLLKASEDPEVDTARVANVMDEATDAIRQLRRYCEKHNIYPNAPDEPRP